MKKKIKGYSDIHEIIGKIEWLKRMAWEKGNQK